MTMHDRHFPNESAAYRRARERLLASEQALRRQIEQVAEERRRLPPGGPPPTDYVFRGQADGEAHDVRLSELFGPHESLVIYSFMYGPDMASACSSCTAILDGLNGQAIHVTQRAGLAVVAKSPLARIVDFAAKRGWCNLRLLSSAANTYNRDYFAEDERGAQWPVANVFHKHDGEVRHFWSSELLFLPPDRGQEGRHVDAIWPLWNVFDWLPEGRGETWNPRLSYDD